MSTNTGIEWTQATWNPIGGCTPNSPGCLNCYAAKMAFRLEKMGQSKYAGLTVLHNGIRTFNGKLSFDERALFAPQKRGKPTTYFVNSMSDLFHEDVPLSYQIRVFKVMASAAQHTYQILTKRPRLMAERLPLIIKALDDECCEIGCEDIFYPPPEGKPLPHVWLGCSPVNQKTADEYVGYLARTPAVVRFLSCEPLIDDMDLIAAYNRGAPGSWTDNKTRIGVDWVIVGNESRGNGVGRLPGNSEAGFWEAARKLRDQCRAAGVAFFLKQAPVNGKTSGNPEDWPEDMRIREMPAQR